MNQIKFLWKDFEPNKDLEKKKKKRSLISVSNMSNS